VIVYRQPSPYPLIAQESLTDSGSGESCKWPRNSRSRSILGVWENIGDQTARRRQLETLQDRPGWGTDAQLCDTLLRHRKFVFRWLFTSFAVRRPAIGGAGLPARWPFARAAPHVALANVTNELSGLVAPDGHALPSHQELSLRVFVKDAGVWQIAPSTIR